ncbi:hypothetical protein [Kordiimonas sp.]|uniref:hypothetical protein n=1 Tax=Kordiimonas sp. TaxID=1970157 RepID=UPI003A917A6A
MSGMKEKAATAMGVAIGIAIVTLPIALIVGVFIAADPIERAAAIIAAGIALHGVCSVVAEGVRAKESETSRRMEWVSKSRCN